MKSPLLSGLARLLLLLGSLVGVPDSMSGAPDATPKPTPGIPANWRNIASGWTIPDEDYADQP